MAAVTGILSAVFPICGYHLPNKNRRQNLSLFLVHALRGAKSSQCHKKIKLVSTFPARVNDFR